VIQSQKEQLPEVKDSKVALWLKPLSESNKDVFNTILLLALLLSIASLSLHSFVFLVVIFMVMLIWETIFSRSRNESIDWRFLYSTVLLTLLVPVDLPLWQIVISTSLGVVLGEQIYGGRAQSFLSAVVVSLAFAFYIFSPTGHAVIDNVEIGWLVILALLLIIFRLLDWLTLLGLLFGTLLTLALIYPSFDATLTAITNLSGVPASFGLCALFILGDSTLSAKTHLGKLLVGMLAGLLIVYLNHDFADLEKLVFALLLTMVSMPLLDWLAQVLSYAPKSETDHGVINE